ncbi:MAG: hypothetical protein FWD02_05575 [Bacteroidales bacterium]|nr:hypothetical protein [Bacteroidales bacterium]
MKKTFKTLLVLCMIVSTAVTCEGRDSEDCHFGITIINSSDYAVYFRDLPDMAYRRYAPAAMIANARSSRVGPGESNRTISRSCIEYNFTKGVAFYDGTFGLLDTLRFFIFDAEILEQELRYKVLKRYDLSLECLRQLNFRVSFPPGEEMRYIAQYPPFGQ